MAKTQSPYVTIKRQELAYYKQCEKVSEAVDKLIGTSFGHTQFFRALGRVISLNEAVEPMTKAVQL